MNFKDRLFGILLIMPALLLMAGFLIYPIAFNIWLSFFEKHAFLPGTQFIGFKNFINLFRDDAFWLSFKNGFIYGTSTVVLQVILGCAAALFLNFRFAGRNFLRGVLLFPYLIPTIIVVILWKWMLDATQGYLNYLMLANNIIDRPIAWFDKDHIMTSLILISVWQFFPFVFLCILARLQTISPELYEAARIDGASSSQLFFYITLPQIKNILFVVILLRGIWMFTKFDVVWLMAGSQGVGKYVETLPVYTFRKTFEYMQMGMGAAMSVVLFVFLVIGAWLCYGFVKQDEKYV